MYRVKTFISGLSKPQTLGILLQRTCASVQTLSDRAQTTHSFLNGSSSVYTEHMYEAWLQDPSSVHKVIHVLKWDLDISIWMMWKLSSSCVVIQANCQRNKLCCVFFFLNSIIKTKRICYKKIYTEERDMLYLWCYFYIWDDRKLLAWWIGIVHLFISNLGQVSL